MIQGKDNVCSFSRRLVTPFLSAQPHQDEDNLLLTFSPSGPDPWVSYRTLELEVAQLHTSGPAPFVPPSELICSDEPRRVTVKGHRTREDHGILLIRTLPQNESLGKPNSPELINSFVPKPRAVPRSANLLTSDILR